MPTERPIIFSGPLVRAILDDRKTQMRRVAKYRGKPGLSPLMLAGEEAEWCPYGKPSDRLWVRETWGLQYPSGLIVKGEYALNYRDFGDTLKVFYRIDNDAPAEMMWRPSVHMPRRLSRITLEIMNVRVERVQDIDIKNARKEDCHSVNPVVEFKALWDSFNAKRGYAWATNPWVWVIEFKRCDDADQD